MSFDVQLIYAALLVLFTVGFLYRYRKNQVRNKQYREQGKLQVAPIDTSKPIPNDKLIVVSSLAQGQLLQALTDFCEARNEEVVTVVTELVVTHDGRLAVVFPYDIQFSVFCEVLNYLVYPIGMEGLEPIAIGWATYPAEEEILPKEMFAKPMMMFVPEEEQNYMQFFMVNSDNLGCHLQLFDPNGYKVHQNPEEQYMAPPFDASNVDAWAKERVEIVS